MLTISRPLSAGQASRYHEEEFQNARENYYTEGEVIRGVWYGGRLRARRRRGLEDERSDRQNGRRPHT